MRVGAIRVRPKAQSAPQAPMRAQNPAPEPRGAPKPRGTLGAPQAGAEPSARSEAGAAEGRPGPGLGRPMCFGAKDVRPKAQSAPQNDPRDRRGDPIRAHGRYDSPQLRPPKPYHPPQP